MGTASGARNRVGRETYIKYADSIDGFAEYYDGTIVDFPATTPLHANIAANVAAEMMPLRRDIGFKVFVLGLRIALDSVNCYFYPDVAIIRGPLELCKHNQDSVHNPLLVVEVLSPSTATRDRGEKFQAYQALESLQEYVLVEQEAPQVYVFTKSSTGEWVHQVYSGLDAHVKLNSLTVSIPLANFYYDVVFPEPNEGKSQG